MSDRTVEIRTTGPIQATIRPPGSKSITNRALICAALADGPSRLLGALDSEDTQVMIQALRTLGLDVHQDLAAQEIRLSGCGGRIPAGHAQLHLANSGTSIRFLTAMLALGRGTYRLDGVARMRERPIEDLLAALRQLGVDVHAELDNGCPPVIVRAAGLPGGSATVRGGISSQYLSALLMTVPYARQHVTLEINGELVSQPYIRLTLAVMEAFGVQVEPTDLQSFPDRHRPALRRA